MIGEDTSSAEAAAPPREAWASLERTSLIDTTLRLEAATAAMGLRRWFWGEGVCAQALVRSASARNTVSQLARDYLDLNVAVEPTIEHVNNMIPAAAAALLYEQDGKAGYKALADKAAQGLQPIWSAPHSKPISFDDVRAQSQERIARILGELGLNG